MTSLSRHFLACRRPSDPIEAGSDPDGAGTRETLSRRNIVKSSVGVAAPGATGGVVLSQVAASSACTAASADAAFQATTVGQGAATPALVGPAGAVACTRIL